MSKCTCAFPCGGTDCGPTAAPFSIKAKASLQFRGTIKLIRTESNHAVSFRLAQYPDGRQTVQGAYQWTEGFQIGEVWRDLPVVMVNEQGEEINNA